MAKIDSIPKRNTSNKVHSGAQTAKPGERKLEYPKPVTPVKFGSNPKRGK